MENGGSPHSLTTFLYIKEPMCTIRRNDRKTKLIDYLASYSPGDTDLSLALNSVAKMALHLRYHVTLVFTTNLKYKSRTQ